MESSAETTWSLPAQHPALGPREVHLWRFRVDGPDAASARALLSPDEIARAERLRVDAKRVQYILARAALRRILAGYLDADPATLVFDYAPHGKPLLAAPHDATALHFNLSHAEAWALLALTHVAPLGVDIEAIRPDRADGRLADRFFSRAEAEGLRALPVEHRPAAFFRCWTCKEAYLKALGGGLSLPLDAFDVSLPPAPPALLAVRDSPEDPAAWRLHPLEVAPGFAAACALRAQDVQFRCFDGVCARFQGKARLT